MAYIDDLNKQQQAAAGGGQVLAGNAGQGSKAGASGSGWTNLQSYLGANQGNTGEIATSVNNAMNKEFNTNATAADTAAKGYGEAGVKTVNAGSNVGAINEVINTTNTAGTDYTGGNAAAQGLKYSGPKTGADIKTGRNEVEQAYDNAYKQNEKYGTYIGARDALRSENNYGSGFAALDSFLGTRNEGKAIGGQIAANQAALKTGDQYRGIVSADKSIADAVSGVQAAEEAAKGQLNDAVYKRGLADGTIMEDAVPDLATSAMPGFSGLPPGILYDTSIDMSQQLPPPLPAPNRTGSSGTKSNTSKPSAANSNGRARIGRNI